MPALNFKLKLLVLFVSLGSDAILHISWILMKHNFWISLKKLIEFESAQPFFLPGSAGNNSPIYLILFKTVSALCVVRKFFNMLFLRYNMVIYPNFFSVLDLVMYERSNSVKEWPLQSHCMDSACYEYNLLNVCSCFCYRDSKSFHCSLYEQACTQGIKSHLHMQGT